MTQRSPVLASAPGEMTDPEPAAKVTPIQLVEEAAKIKNAANGRTQVLPSSSFSDLSNLVANCCTVNVAPVDPTLGFRHRSAK